MISSNDLRPGITIELEGVVWVVVQFQHVKPGKGAAFVRTKIRNVETGNTIERTFRAGERVNRAYLDHKQMQFLYAVKDEYTFMDMESYEQVVLKRDELEDHRSMFKRKYHCRHRELQRQTYRYRTAVICGTGCR